LQPVLQQQHGYPWIIRPPHYLADDVSALCCAPDPGGLAQSPMLALDECVVGQ
jgi:hypothetical protein